MDALSWALSNDSLIVAGALSTAVPARHIVPLVALFGICDAAGSMLGPLPGIQIAILYWLAPVLLVVWGIAILRNPMSLAGRSRLLHCVYLLPPLMAIDNLLVPTQSPVEAGCISSAMAALGFALGFGLLRRVERHALEPRLPGALLVTAGLLIAA
jgi:putative Mn2+ efflux pump MntP